MPYGRFYVKSYELGKKKKKKCSVSLALKNQSNSQTNTVTGARIYWSNQHITRNIKSFPNKKKKKNTVLAKS